MIFTEGNIITLANISLNPASGRSINDILYQRNDKLCEHNNYSLHKI